MRTLRPLTLALLLLTLAGCATWGPGGAPHHHTAGYTVTIPPGWIFHPSLGGELIATREGLVLQRLSVRGLALPHTLARSKRSLAKDLGPFDLAEELINEDKADRALGQFTVTAQTAVKIGGIEGVRIDSTHATEEGLRLSTRRWAAVRGDTLWLATYTAPTRHYFDRDLPAVTAAIEAIRFDPDRP